MSTLRVTADKQEKNLLYVIEVETWVSSTLRPFSSDTVEDYWLVSLWFTMETSG